MNNAEKFKQLFGLYATELWSKPEKDFLTWLNMEYVPDTNAVDTISRQAAIDAADGIINRDTSGNNDVVKAMTAWKEYIKALPSAQPRKGKWLLGEVETGAFNIQYQFKRCSECGWESSLVIPRNFCPNCGSYNGGDAE